MTNHTFQTATATIARLTDTSSITRPTEPPYYMTAPDYANEILRDLLNIDDDAALIDSLDLDYYATPTDADPALLTIDTLALAHELAAAIDYLRTDSFAIQYLSELRLAHSLCPIHHCDYAICFDDDEPECATIRTYFPNHDS